MASLAAIARIAIVPLLVTAMAAPAHAHIVGAFGDFLAGLEDETTLERLQQQLDETAAEIAELTPQVDALRTEYEGREDSAVAKLLFYKSIWLDTYSSMVLQSDDLVDLIANQRLMARKVDEDIASVNTLYLRFKQLELTRNALIGHQDVLSMIQSNLRAREELLARYDGMPANRLARIVTAIWETSAAAYVDEYLIADARVINRDPAFFFSRETNRSAFLLAQEKLNAISIEQLTDRPEDTTTGQQISGKLTYNVRPDHVYVHYVNDDASQEFVDLILIGQVQRRENHKIALVFEAGYVNGIVLPTEYLTQLEGFELDYAAINPGSSDFAAEQTSGAILIQPIEGAGE